MNKITITHGNGGKQTHELIEEIFYKSFKNPYLKNTDGAIINLKNPNIVVSTDSFVVKPIFFPGGNIGKLAITGTINDLAVMGAKPLYITAGFILEEGLEVSSLKEIINSMAKEIQRHEIFFVAGDTKVVSKGEADSIFITTTGIGILLENHPLGLESINDNDVVIISGTIGDHGSALYLKRNNLDFDANIESDCNSVYFPIEALLKECKTIKIIRDPTRGGLGTVLNEFVQGQKWGIEIYEDQVPIKDEVKGICDLLGIDVFHLACEGRFVFVISESEKDKAMNILKKFPLTENASIIGKISSKYPERVVLHTRIGGKRILDMLSNEILPRIC
ncbi:MAG: hydrogenase expression/formation protein HypE [Leptospiraceae bacterium]|jgi:hydrogenase expression/formation protein HypE|nr:hydrogenase expression/formation protein HypE [Leptospiraceae bacterium]